MAGRVALVPKACMPAAAAAPPPPSPTWRTWQPACSRAVGRRCSGLQHHSSSSTCSTRTTHLGISCQASIAYPRRGTHQQGSATSSTWADTFHYHGSSRSTEDWEGGIVGDAAGAGDALCYDSREGQQGSSQPHSARAAGAGSRGQGTVQDACYSSSSYRREDQSSSSHQHRAAYAGAGSRGQGAFQDACYSSSSYRREGGSHQHSAGAGSRGQGADQDACLGRGERLVCFLAMAIPFAEGMLRLTALLLERCRHMVLEFGAWAWVNGASTAAALRASPVGSDVATALHANLAACQGVMSLTHAAYARVLSIDASMAQLMYPAALPGTLLSSATAATSGATSSATAGATAGATAAALLQQAAGMFPPLPSVSPGAAAAGAAAGGKKAAAAASKAAAAAATTAAATSGAGSSAALAGFPSATSLGDMPLGMLGSSLSWIDLTCTLAWLALTLLWVTRNQMLREQQPQRVQQPQQQLRGGQGSGEQRVPALAGMGPAAAGVVSRPEGDEEGEAAALQGGVSRSERRRVELVAAVCLCALVLRLSWAPLVPLASSWLSDTLYRPIVQLLTVVVTSLALGTMIKVALFPPSTSKDWSENASLLVTFTQGLARGMVRLLQLDLLLLVLQQDERLTFMAVLCLALSYCVYCLVLVWLQYLMGQLQFRT